MNPAVRVEESQGLPLAVVRRVASARELSTVVPAACGAVWNFLRAQGVTGAGRHVAVYLDGEINLLVGVELAGDFTPGDGVDRATTPSGPVVTATHIGPYHRLGEAHDAIHAWCKANGHQLAGPNWEIYGHGIDDTTPPRTDVFYLLKPR